MFVVIDANELFSLLIKGIGKSEAIFFSDKIKLIAPEFLLIEFSKHKKEILSKTHRSEEDFFELLSIFERRITFISKREFKGFISKAFKLFPDHIKDIPYLALAMKFDCVLWSEEKLLKNQLRVKVLNTDELFSFIFSRSFL